MTDQRTGTLSDAQRDRQALNAAMTEKQFMDQVIQMATVQGWLVAHVPDRLYGLAAKAGRHYTMGGAKGLPDLIMVHPERSGAPIVFAELKTQKGRVRPEQRAWLDAIQERMGILIGDYVIADVFRPSDLDYLQALLEGRDEWRQTA